MIHDLDFFDDVRLGERDFDIADGVVRLAQVVGRWTVEEVVQFDVEACSIDISADETLVVLMRGEAADQEPGCEGVLVLTYVDGSLTHETTLPSNVSAISVANNVVLASGPGFVSYSWTIGDNASLSPTSESDGLAVW